MKKNELKMRKYKEILNSAVKAGEISELEMEILEGIFKKNIGVMVKIQ